MRKLKVVAVLALVLCMAACSQLTSVEHGFLGKPMNEAAAGGDMPAWYHVGEALNPFLHAIIAILRTALGL